MSNNFTNIKCHWIRLLCSGAILSLFVAGLSSCGGPAFVDIDHSLTGEGAETSFSGDGRSTGDDGQSTDANGNIMDVEAAEEILRNSPESTATDSDSRIVTAEEIDAVNTLCAAGTPVEIEHEITFEEPTATCEWGAGGNMEFDVSNQLIITARREQSYHLELPAGAVVCDLALDFGSNPQQMRYDDEIFLLFDHYVVMSSQDYTVAGELQRDENDMVVYNWERLVGQTYPIRARPNFFMEPACTDDTCTIPPTETSGMIQMAVQSETARKLALARGIGVGANPSMAHKFTFVTTGDNDSPIDCMHYDFSLTAKVSYVLSD